MTRLEAHFFKRSQQERDKKAIRAANSLLKPRKIRACKPRISEREPRKGTETKKPCQKHEKHSISEREPRKGTETTPQEREALSAKIFQNVNPERGRKRIRCLCVQGEIREISEREPRKGTETFTSRDISRGFVTFQNVNPERGRKQSPSRRTQ